MSLKGFLLCSIIAAGIITGCGKLTASHYNQIKAGMDYNEINTILGVPDMCANESKIKQCRWGSKSENIKVTFINNTATSIAQNNLK
ncbi:DUF3862 domain-containing protein [Catenovulum adriaticum]|uniref:DUF3862 domain-containing protein n=1 Tax=Catenovulum adriaticum TaxID=2984846 RepID=A0ABY7ARE2_9ALTE|nr:DUF3862 domain-containing protein [Catenovulum sp. TS8]WAJ72104.1 DUF3862 domain-containing protein [Catenovulum sp. TS8]